MSGVGISELEQRYPVTKRSLRLLLQEKTWRHVVVKGFIPLLPRW